MTRKVFIATPAFGGLITQAYFNGMARLSSTTLNDWQVITKIIGNESLIQRARQYLAAIALYNEYEKLLFIDADIGFTGEDVKRIINHDRPVVGGVYSLKSIPPRLNYNPLPTQDVSNLADPKTPAGFKQFAEKYADPEGLVEVRHVPTGFMCIDLKVLKTLAGVVPSYSGKKYGLEKYDKIPELFPVKIIENNLESEDWTFCTICRENGIKIYLDTKIILTHSGNITIDISRDIV